MDASRSCQDGNVRRRITAFCCGRRTHRAARGREGNKKRGYRTPLRRERGLGGGPARPSDRDAQRFRPHLRSRRGADGTADHPSGGGPGESVGDFGTPKYLANEGHPEREGTGMSRLQYRRAVLITRARRPWDVPGKLTVHSGGRCVTCWQNGGGVGRTTPPPDSLSPRNCTPLPFLRATVPGESR